MKTALIASLALTLAACGGPLFYAEVQEQEICIDFPGENAPYSPVPIPATQAISTESSFDVGSQIPGLDKNGTTGSIKVTKLTITGDAAALKNDIQSAEIDLPDDTGTLQPTLTYATAAPTAGALDCPTGSATCTISMKVVRQDDLLKALLAAKGALAYKLSLAGQPPTAPWTVDMNVCMTGSVKVDLLKVASSN